MWPTNGHPNCRLQQHCDQSNNYNRPKNRPRDKYSALRQPQANTRPAHTASNRTGPSGPSCMDKRRIMRVIKWPLVHLCLPFCLIVLLFNVLVSGADQTKNEPANHLQVGHLHSQLSRPETNTSAARATDQHHSSQVKDEASGHLPRHRGSGGLRRARRSASNAAVARPTGARSLLMPINELRVSGSKLEPPSRPSQDWSKQRPYFGQQVERNLTVELGKTAHLTCKVFELGDKTVSWLRPRQNEILTAGRYTYIGDSRISSMNENGSPEWILEIKDVGLNDSTSYECQVSTDPKMSMLINLHVLAARARIKQSENNYYPVGANIEFACEVLLPSSPSSRRSATQAGVGSPTQTYWYHNGNLINYARSALPAPELSRSNTNFTIDWDPPSQTSRLKLHNIQTSDSGNYTCKPTAAEPATVRLFVKKHRSNSNGNRVHYSGGSYYVPNNKEVQRGRQPQQQHYGFDAATGLEIGDASSGAPSSLPTATVSQLLLWISFEMALAVAAINLLTANHRPSSALGSSFLDAS